MAVEKERVHGLHEKANRFDVEVKISSTLLTSLLTYFPTVFITLIGHTVMKRPIVQTAVARRETDRGLDQGQQCKINYKPIKRLTGRLKMINLMPNISVRQV